MALVGAFRLWQSTLLDILVASTTHARWPLRGGRLGDLARMDERDLTYCRTVIGHVRQQPAATSCPDLSVREKNIEFPLGWPAKAAGVVPLGAGEPLEMVGMVDQARARQPALGWRAAARGHRRGPGQ